LLALALVTVLALRQEWGWLEALLGIAAVFLALNALSGRCYLWRSLGINSCERGGGPPRPTQKDASSD
jgi:hypothetical protein